MTAAEVPEQAVTAALKAAPDQHIGLGHWEPIMSRADMRRTLEAAAPAIREAAVSQLAVADTMICGECNYPLHRCPACRHLIGHDGYDDHQCRVAELEQLAADMLSRYVSAARLGGPVAISDALIAKWETILKGTP